jgi:hypothetical protein
MPLQTSGAISLNDIHVEAGGTSGTQASINDTDIRGLIYKAGGTTMSFSEWYGASTSTVIAVTQGTLSGQFFTTYGFEDATPTGSVSPSSVNGNTLFTMTIKRIARTQSSAGLFFEFELSYSTANAISASEFTSIQFTANGTLTTLTSAEASTTTTQGGFGRRWDWTASNGLDSTELANIAAEWDGSGVINVTVNP